MHFRFHISTKFILLTLVTFSLFSCENEEIKAEDVDLGYQYYPLTMGDSRTYHVRQIDYLLTGRDTLEYFVREVVEDTTHDFDEISYHMYRYYSEDTTLGWSLDSIWQTKKLPGQLIRTRNNIRYIRLIFPVEEDKIWDGNALNTANNDDYEYTDIGSSYTIDNQNYDNTVTVQQGDNLQTLIDTDFRNEVYAAHVGLIYKYQQVLYHQPGDDTTGVLFIQKMIDHAVQ